MTVQLNPIVIADDTWIDLVNKVNEIVDNLGTKVVSANSTQTVGDVQLVGALTANALYVGNNAVVTVTRNIQTSNGLSGGGNLSSNLTISLSANTIASLAKADTALQPNAFNGKLGLKDKIAVPGDIDAIGTANSITVLAGDGSWRPLIAVGDMNKAIYDPTGVNADAFNRSNHKGIQGSNTIAGLDTTLSNLSANVAARMPISVYDPQLINRDAFARENHTGTQPANTITGLSVVATTGVYADLTSKTAVEYASNQSLTATQQGQARANIDAGILVGFRNKLLNGNLDIWQRGTAQSVSGYGSADRWSCSASQATRSTTRQPFALGQADVPGNPTYFIRHDVTASLTQPANMVVMEQPMEGVETLAGRRATLTFYAKADAAKPIAVEFVQSYGTGGSPSNRLTGIEVHQFTLSTTWQKYQAVVDIPSIAGKTLGTNGDDYFDVVFWMSSGTTYSARNANLPIQTGIFDFAHISIVEGDATAETDPFEYRHPALELTLCQRYYEVNEAEMRLEGLAGGGYYIRQPWRVEKRSTPTLTATSVISTNITSQTVTDASRFGVLHQVSADAAGAFRSKLTITADAELL